MIKDVPHPRLGSVRMTNTPVSLSRTPGGAELPAPDMGEHTEQVLRELAGMDDCGDRLPARGGRDLARGV